MKCTDVYPSDVDASATSSRLLHAAQHWEQDAWERLVQLYSRRMYRWCRQAGLQAADAANVVQEAFGAVARKLPDFSREREGATFRGWLRCIVENKIRDHYRRLGRRNDVAAGGTDAHRFLADIAAFDATTEMDDASQVRVSPVEGQPRLAAAVAAVRDEVGQRNWKFFWRTAIDGQSAAEVGQEFGVTANAVRIVKMRVLRRLREQLASLAPEQGATEE